MSITVGGANLIPWWKEPSKDQWLAWIAAWLGWTLDSFDFTVFLLLMVPISKDFGVPLTEVAVVFTLTLWMRLVGATASGWLADRIGRKKPLMISIAWFSACNLLAGLAPSLKPPLPPRTPNARPVTQLPALSASPTAGMSSN
jgi:MFS transporter, SHS family, lactate transporter